MPAIALTPAERKSHRSAAHHLDPVVMIGADGLTDAVAREADAALKAHGLIKVRVFSDDRTAREALLATLADRLNAAPIQHIGKLLVLWRPLPPKAAAEPAEDRGAGPRFVKIVKFSKSGNHRATVKKVKVLGNERVTAGGLVKRAKSRPASAKAGQAPKAGAPARAAKAAGAPRGAKPAAAGKSARPARGSKPAAAGPRAAVKKKSPR